jgi:hypothetical protein
MSFEHNYMYVGIIMNSLLHLNCSHHNQDRDAGSWQTSQQENRKAQQEENDSKFVGDFMYKYSLLVLNF